MEKGYQGKTSKIQIKCGVQLGVLYQFWLLCYDKWPIVMYDSNSMGIQVRGTWIIFVLSLQLFHKPKNILIKGYFKFNFRDAKRFKFGKLSLHFC